MLGHLRSRKYTHLVPTHLVEPTAELSKRINIADVVMRPAKHHGNAGGKSPLGRAAIETNSRVQEN